MNKFEEGLLKYLTNEQLKTIQQKKIGIGGAGGLGSNIAMILVRTGFKNIEIIDKDLIDASNLNRQQFFLSEIGLDKAETLRSRLLAINPDINILYHKVHWTKKIGNEFFEDSDVIVEAFDQTDWKHQFVEFYQQTGKPIISGVGMAGLIQKNPMIVKKLGNIYFVGDLTTDSECGHPPLAPRVTACAAVMSEIILDLALNLKINA